MFKEYEPLWHGKHKDTCVMKDLAGFKDQPARAKKPKGNIPGATKRKCVECKAMFIYRMSELQVIKGRLIVVKQGPEITGNTKAKDKEE